MKEKVEIFLYTYKEGSSDGPYQEWEENLPLQQQAIIWSRLERIRLGNFGDAKKLKGVGKSIYELRIHTGPGFRIYFGKEGKSVVIILFAGDKKSQKRDVLKAIKYWEDYKASKG